MATESGPPGDSLATTTVIHAQGDVILRLTTDDGHVAKFLVSSQTLSLASGVFKAMFDGRFAEGQGLSTAAPPEVELPDDDLESIMILCSIAHLRARNVPVQLSIVELSDFAILCDKYDCIEAVEPYVKPWLQRHLPCSNDDDYEKLLLVTFLLDQPKEFYEVTQRLVRDRKTHIQAGTSTYGHDFLPAELILRLQDAHTTCQKEATQAPYVPAVLAICEAGHAMLGRYLSNLICAKLWPIKEMSISQLLEQAKSMPKLEGRHYIKNHQCACQDDFSLNYITVDNFARIYNGVKGLCLDCVKRGDGPKNKECRVTHE